VKKKRAIAAGAGLLCFSAPAAFLTAWLSTCVLSRLPARPSKPIVVFRYDDVSALSDAEIERGFVRAFAEKRLQCVLGVIPFEGHDRHNPRGTKNRPLSKEKIDFLKRAIAAGAVEVMLHGYSHRMVRRGEYSEFSRLPVEEQREKISEGKEFLQDRLGERITSFIPPWQSYDAGTQAALEALGFSCISASLKFDSEPSANLKYLPSTSDPRGLRKAVSCARAVKGAEPIIVCLAHPFDFLESGDSRARFSLSYFRELLDWVADQKDLEVLSARQLIESGVDLSARRLLANARLARGWATPFFRPPCGLYPSTRFCRNLRRALLFFYAMVTTAGFGSLLLLSAMLPSRGKRFFVVAACLVGGALVVSLAYGLGGSHVGLKNAVASVFLAGALLGLAAALFVTNETTPGKDKGAQAADGSS